MTQKKIFSEKIKKGVKNAEFHADFESVENVLRKCTKKVISKNVTEKCSFSLLLMLAKFVLLLTFFWYIS
jgi:hypothetical protein